MSEDPNPTTEEELLEYLRGLLEKPHDYNTSAEALRDGTLACFNYMAGKLGNSGFQASWAALHLIGSVNGYDGPYAIINAENMLYPQYGSPVEQARDLEAKWQSWASEEARKKLAEYEEKDLRPADRVLAHWLKLANST